jgi:hypothetical protein
MQIGMYDFQLCITDTRNDRCLMMEDYLLENVSSGSDLVNVLKSIFDNHHLLLANFWNSIHIAIKTKKYTLIPGELFEEGLLTDYLKYSAELEPENENYYHYWLKDFDAVNVFAVDKQLEEFLLNTYPYKIPKFIHQADALISGLKKQQLHPDRQMLLYRDRNQLHILILDKGQLNFYNQFAIKGFKEFSKYVSLIAQELELDLENDPVLLWGFYSDDSEEYPQIRSFIRRIGWGDGPKFVKLGYQFDEIPSHQYFDLYSIYLCQ